MEELSKTKGFIKKNIVFMILAGLLCTFGMTNSAFLVAGLMVFTVAIMFSSDEHRFCWSLFLVSNIRIFDDLGVKFLVNILMVLPLLFYVIRKLSKPAKSVHLFPILGGIVLFLMASSYAVFFQEEVAPLIMWALAFIWCVFISIDDEINVDKNDVIYALSSGVIFSALVYIITEPDYLSNIISYMNTGFRFMAFGSDPNYYSLYLCIALASIVIKPKIKLSDYILAFVLVCIGFLTESKMAMILMAICVVYLVAFTANNINKHVRNVVIFACICVAVYLLRGTILAFLDNLLKRAGGSGATINDVSSGRWEILLECLYVFANDVPTTIIGKGLNYYNHFGSYGQIARIAHNTYVDVILSWGIVGTALFIWIISFWFKLYKNRKEAKAGYTRISKFPFLIMLLGFFALSCLDAGMFYFVITACMFQLEPKKQIKEINEEENEQ